MKGGGRGGVALRCGGVLYDAALQRGAVMQHYSVSGVAVQRCSVLVCCSVFFSSARLGV